MDWPPPGLYTFVILTFFTICEGSEWSYKDPTGPSTWRTFAAKCGKGKEQSPININSFEAKYDPALTKILFSIAYNKTIPDGKLFIKNNGHTVKVIPMNGDYTIESGGLPGKYRLVQFHFHWGSQNGQGSEHTLNGDRYPMEVHFVHSNMRYGNISEAIKHPDGLAVLGIMFKPSDTKDNDGLTPLADAVGEVAEVGMNTTINSLALFSLLGKDFNFLNFYEYNGSLTTPGCQESVFWVVYHSTVPISWSQMEKFRALKTTNGKSLTDNYRPLQALNNRKVLRSFKTTCSEPAHPKSSNGTTIAWNYRGEDGPVFWSKHFSKCAGRHQSPINIVTRETPFHNELVPFQMTEDFSKVPRGEWLMKNDGHTLKVVPTSGMYNISRGNSLSTYRLAQFHFHWGLHNDEGSEHSFNGDFFPMEMHLVHFNNVYRDIKEAIKHPDGLAVLGFMFEVGDEYNQEFQKITSNLHVVSNAGLSKAIQPLNFMKLFGGENNLKAYYRYHGSLTTPGCQEVVMWTLYVVPIKISTKQLAAFRELKDSHGELMGNNFRPVQPMFGRHVLRSAFNAKPST